MSASQIYVEKIVLSLGLGNRKDALRNIASHFKQLIDCGQELKITRAKKGIAKWAIRANEECGLMVTLRKAKCETLIKKLNATGVFENAKFSSNTLSVGVKNHRKLKLEKYNLRAPEYGFNIYIVFGFKGLRCYKRKFDRQYGRKNLEMQQCMSAFKKIIC